MEAKERAWRVPHRGLLLWCFLFTTAVGGYELWRGLSAGTIRPLDVATLERGGQVPGVWLRVEGRALWDKASVVPSDDDTGAAYLVPVVSREWQHPGPVGVFLEIRRRVDEGPPGGTEGVASYDGTVVFGRGVGSRQREQFTPRGIRPAEQYVLLDPGGSPRKLVRNGLMFLGIGCAALALIPLIGWAHRRWG
jgi:hypothetical protein